MSIVYTILVFGVIIFIHELGHFIVAKLSKIKVLEFALGMGPKILKYQGKETLYALRLFPIGGFVSMEGELEESEDHRAFGNVSRPKRAAVMAAGAFMNLVLGLILISLTLIGEPQYASATVSEFKDNSVSSQTGLQAGDTIKKMNGTTIFVAQDIVFELYRAQSDKFNITVVRDGKTLKLENVSFPTGEEDGKRAISMDFYVEPIPANFTNGLSRVFGETFSNARNAWVSVSDLITGRIGFQELSSPVGVGQVIGEIVKTEDALRNIVSLAAILSISVGMFNLLPFPALDGGRLLFLLIEAIRRKPFNKNVEGYINAAGLLLLFGLMIVVVFKDIWNLF